MTLRRRVASSILKSPVSGASMNATSRAFVSCDLGKPIEQDSLANPSKSYGHEALRRLAAYRSAYRDAKRLDESIAAREGGGRGASAGSIRVGEFVHADEAYRVLGALPSDLKIGQARVRRKPRGVPPRLRRPRPGPGYVSAVLVGDIPECESFHGARPAVGADPGRSGAEGAPSPSRLPGSTEKSSPGARRK